MQRFLKLTSVPALALASTLLVSAPSIAHAARVDAPVEKEWTFLVFLNGHNNLDSFGAMDINEMEKVGSDANINVVVQWASLQNRDTRRLLVQKDFNTSTVTSPVLESMPAVDMGDYRNLVEFVRWGVEHYPAKHYFVDVWDHGGGWHKISGEIGTRDISWDDNTGSFMTTEQLGEAMRQASGIIGHKVDLYGSDACLMAMAEVAGEMRDAVQVSVGSEEVEPGAGWPYDKLLERWAVNPTASPADVATILAETYLASYNNGSQGRSSVTFSAFNLEKSDVLHNAVRDLSAQLKTLGSSERKKVTDAFRSAQHFTYSDYSDILDFLGIVERSRPAGVDSTAITAVRDAVSQYVITSKNSPSYSRATGVAFWTPSSKSKFNSYRSRYFGLRFHQETGWGEALNYVLQDATN